MPEPVRRPERLHAGAAGTWWRLFIRSLISLPVLLNASLAMILFVAFELAVNYTTGSGGRAPIAFASGVVEVLALGAIALLAAGVVELMTVQIQQRLHVAAEQQWKREALAAENAAVARVCQIVVLEFSQPLSGILAYSELLTAGGEYTSAAQRLELEGLREGAVQLERLLAVLRAATSSTAGGERGHRVAREIELAVTQPRQRLHQPPLMQPPAPAAGA